MSSFFKTIGGVITAIVVSLIVIVGGFFVVTQFMLHTADYRGNVGVHNQINANPNYIIPAYDHFHDLCAAVQTDKQKIQLSYSTMKHATPEQKSELFIAIQAQKGKLFNDVNQYNTDARKSYTLGQFRDSSLPWTLLTKGKTVCP